MEINRVLDRGSHLLIPYQETTDITISSKKFDDFDIVGLENNRTGKYGGCLNIIKYLSGGNLRIRAIKSSDDSFIITYKNNGSKDKVVINGILYKSSMASIGSGSVSNKITYITRYVSGAKHPYNTTNDLGWMDEKDISKYEEEINNTQKFTIGAKVIINGSLYKSSNAENPSGSVSNKTTYITRYAKNSKHPYNTTGDLGWMDEKDIKLADNKIYYTVKDGDTLSSIAAKYNMSWKELYAKNKFVIGNNPNIIKVGQKLMIK